MDTMDKTIGIIGAGAAGLMAAATVKELLPESTIILFEKNAALGAKVIISGGGRCNVTTGIFDVKKLLLNYPRGAKFLMSAMFRFPPEKVKEWFENHGVPLKIEEDLRIFPKSNNGKDIVKALEKTITSTDAEILTKAWVTDIVYQENDRRYHIFLKDGKSYFVDILIITTGGNAYRHTGSTGDGYAWAKKLGHTITELAPSLNAFTLSEEWGRQMAGVSITDAILTIKSMKTGKKYERRGPFVFTHTGLSGPSIFALSSLSAYEHYDSKEPLSIFINFFPDFSPEKLEEKFLELSKQHGKKMLVNFLDLFLPKSLCEIFAKVCYLPENLIIHQLNKEGRKKILHHLQSFECHINGKAGGEEFVTAGGVDTNEVSTNTMESKICPGLYFAGEILNIDGFTGGFNLQASWATGRLCGESIVKTLSWKR